MVGEASKVDKLICDEWKNKVNELTSWYNAEDIFNGDKLGLFWKLTLNQTYFYRENQGNLSTTIRKGVLYS